MSALPPDEDHPYGHGRFEAVGSLGVSALLLLTAWHIAAHAYDKLQHCLVLPLFSFSLGETLPWLQTGLAALRGGHMGLGVSCSAAPSLLAVGAALASIVVKELLYQVTASVGLKHNSQVLLANAVSTDERSCLLDGVWAGRVCQKLSCLVLLACFA